MRCGAWWTKLKLMDTFIALCLLVAALIPLGIALRDFVTDATPPARSAAALFYEGDSEPSTFPSLATLKDLEDTAPTFVKRNEWWTE